MEKQVCSLAHTYLRYPIPDFDYSNNCVLAGGALRDSIQNVQYKDLDIFGPDKATLEQFAETNLIPQGYKKVYTSKWAYTYTKPDSPVVQLVYGRPLESYEQLLYEFPFTINQFLFNGCLLYATPEALIDTFLHLIRVNTLSKEDIFDTLSRVTRYQKKGYSEVNDATKSIMTIIESLTPEEVAMFSVRPPGYRHGGY